jgi:ubiquitin carboxyl-terminal hydrolase 14
MLGGMIKDDKPWSAYAKVKAGCTITLMGSAEGKELKDPTTVKQFVEDMTPEQKAAALLAKTGYVIPAGLDNLGNTCYMNSVVQCVKRVNEFKKYLQDYELDEKNKGLANDPNVVLTQSAKGLFTDLDKKGESFAPYEFV